jgi:hypothetical protein
VGESAPDFRDTLLELIDTSPEPMEPMDHPSPDHWLAYHRGELSAEEEARLQEHLVRCRDCFDLAAGAAAFAQPDAEPGPGQEVETAALWRLLRPQLEAPPQSPTQAVRAISAGPRRRPSRRFRLPESLAALFFVALVGLAAWNLHLRSALEALRAPRPNALIVDFSAGERLPTLPTAPEKILSAATGPWTLVFHPAGELAVYRLALRDAATGRELGSYELQPDEDLALTLHLGLDPGRYRLELADGAGGGAGKVLETHLLQVTEADGGE